MLCYVETAFMVVSVIIEQKVDPDDMLCYVETAFMVGSVTGSFLPKPQMILQIQWKFLALIIFLPRQDRLQLHFQQILCTRHGG